MRPTLVLLIFLLSTVATAQERRLPLDPLTDAERERATSIANASPRIREFLGKGRSRHIYTEFIAVKDAKSGEAIGRSADVLFYRYEDNSGLRALVDLDRGSVADLVPVNGRSVPLTAAEIEEAARLALASAAVRRLFGEQIRPFEPAVARRAPSDDRSLPRIGGLRTLGGAPDDPCTRGRCVVLFFRVENRYLHLNEVVVDLTTNRVLVRRGGAR